jgi:hypothetical protein
MTAPLPDYYKLRTKDIQNLLTVSERTASRILKDIKEALEVPAVLMQHFKLYFKV